jgi:hypothetical protein
VLPDARIPSTTLLLSPHSCILVSQWKY